MFRAFQLLIKLCDLPVRKLELFFSAFDVLQDEVVRLVGSLDQPLVKLGLSITRFELLLELLDLLKHALGLLLLLLQTVCEQQTLLNSALSSRRCLRDSLNESIANVVGPIALYLVVFSNMHDCLVKLSFDHLIVCQSLLADSQVCLYVSVTLPS